jgi:prepilin-type N-terminal cleavage/methylation domain-containing protein
MKTKTSRRGFTLIELLVAIVVLALAAAGAYIGYMSLLPKFRARQAATQARNIHVWLVTYANEHGGNFPEGDNANEAYRELFKSKLGADEKQFAIQGDAYHKPAPKGEPDGDEGKAPDFAQALETGENAFAYVSGLNSSDPARLPLVANGFSAKPGVWSKNKDEKGGVFQGRYGVVCRVGGSSVAHDLKEGEWMVKEKDRGLMVNIFTPEFEDSNGEVLNPL